MHVFRNSVAGSDYQFQSIVHVENKRPEKTLLLSSLSTVESIDLDAGERNMYDC